MTPEAEWDAAVAEQPEHSRVRARSERGDEERDAVADRMLAREMERRDASARAAPSPREDDAHLCHWGSTTKVLDPVTMAVTGELDFDLQPAASSEAAADEQERIIAAMVETCACIEEHLDIQRSDPNEPLHERLTRVGLVIIEVLDARRRADNRSKRWQARARKAEARIAALTEERDGLTLRLGAKVARQIAKRKGGR